LSGRYRLTLKAADDLKAINDYTARIWGNEQRRKYIGEMRQRFRWLADHPRLGRERPELRNNCYSYPQGEHMIFYAIRSPDIEILAVIHNRSLPEFLKR
jgi:toxin ParE1/3/4